MITCDVIGPTGANGGLGNQMFVAAATLAMAKRNDDVATFPDILRSEYKPYRETIFRKLQTAGNKADFDYIYEEPCFHYKKIPYVKNMCIRGYYQSEKYFEDSSDYIKKMFSIPLEIDEHIKQKSHRFKFFYDI